MMVSFIYHFFNLTCFILYSIISLVLWNCRVGFTTATTSQEFHHASQDYDIDIMIPERRLLPLNAMSRDISKYAKSKNGGGRVVARVVHACG